MFSLTDKMHISVHASNSTLIVKTYFTRWRSTSVRWHYLKCNGTSRFPLKRKKLILNISISFLAPKMCWHWTLEKRMSLEFRLQPENHWFMTRSFCTFLLKITDKAVCIKSLVSAWLVQSCCMKELCFCRANQATILILM